MATFAIWMDRVDRVVLSRAGVSVYDLPDCMFHDWFDSEMTAREAAEEALHNMPASQRGNETSTRSIIARKVGEGWEGRYHHWDGYPEGLGATLFSARNQHFEKDTEKMLRFLIDEHPAGWSNIIDTDFSKEVGYGCEGPNCYCHGQRSEEGYLHTDSDEHFGGAEWCYVLDNHEMTVMERVYSGGTPAVQFFGVDVSEVVYGARWKVVGVVDLDWAEPDWGKMTT